jgi:hypothetical protein
MSNEPVPREKKQTPHPGHPKAPGAGGEDEELKPANEQVEEDIDDEWRRAGGASPASGEDKAE